MASAYFGGNVTKYNAGGSGDNCIADGYIKTVEKVWLDNYTIAFTLTKTTLDIAIIPTNKKLTSVEVMIETSTSQTSGSLALGFSEDAAYGTIMAQTDITHNKTATTIKLPGGILNNLNADGSVCKIGAFQKVITGTQTTITLQLNNWTMTTGTIKSIVRYT